MKLPRRQREVLSRLDRQPIPKTELKKDRAVVLHLVWDGLAVVRGVRVAITPRGRAVRSMVEGRAP